MKDKVLRAVLALQLIITLTISNFILVGRNLIAYALEDGNVRFTAYFKNEEGEKVSQTEYDMKSTDMKLYLEVSVENGVSFDGVVTLEHSNFKLKQDKLSESIEKIEGNTITLKRIRAGNVVKIELAIEPIIEESYADDMLNKQSVLRLTGNYDDGTEEIKKIEIENQVTLNLTVPQNIDTTLEEKVLTNRIYKIGEANKRIVQIQLNSSVVGNAYPISNTIFELGLPEGVEAVEVISKGTYATNGEADRKIENYTWDETNKQLQVKIENISKDGKISWKNNAIDNIIVTLLLPEETVVEAEEYAVKANVQFYGEEAKTIEKEEKYTLAGEADGIIRASIDNKEEIYKGKIYSKEEREYRTTTNIEVNYANLIEGASINEKATYTTEETEDLAANIEYKTTIISKTEFDKVLGINGTLVIKDQNGNVIKEVKATDFETTENITITYPEGVKQLTIEITKAVETGIIRLNHVKVIKAEEYSEKEIDAIKYLVEQAKVKYSTAEYTFERKKELRDTTSEVALTVPQTITSEGNNEMPIAITLKTDHEKYELFENPVFTLTMPEGVTVNNVSDGAESTLYGGLTISKLEAINSREIRIEIAGTQTEYVKSNINTQINFTANVSVEKLMPNKIDTIKMQYENKGNAYNIESEPVNVIASNLKVLTHLKVENFDGKGATLENYNNSTAEVKGELPLENAEEINATVTYTVINNYDSEIIARPVIEAIYTDREGNEEQLINYLEENVSLNPGEMKHVTRDLKIPAGLYYEDQINVATSLEYIYSGTTYTPRNKINLATEGKRGLRDTSIIDNKIKVETFAQLGDGSAVREGDEVYNEQIVQYIIEVTNISNETISNLKVTNTQDNGNIYDLKEVWVYNWVISQEPIKEHRYAELEDTEKSFTIEELTPGESRELLCRVVVKRNEIDAITSANINIFADGIEEKSIPEISNNVKDAKLKISIEKALNEEVQKYGEESLQTLTYIENLSNEKIENINVRLYLSEGLIWKEDYSVEALTLTDDVLNLLGNIEYNEEENYLDFAIISLEAGQEIKISAFLYIDSIPLEKSSIEVSVYAQINNIISNAVKVNAEQLRTDISIVQSVNISEGQKVKNGESFTITAEIINTGYKDAVITVEDNLASGFEVQKVEIIRNDEIIDKTKEEQTSLVYFGTEISKGEKITVRIEIRVNTSKITEKELSNKIWVTPSVGDIIVSNEIVIEIESDVDTSTGTEGTDEPEIEHPENENPDYENPDEENPDDENPDDENPDEENPDDENPDEENPDEENPDEENPDEENPDDENPDDENPDDENPDDENPDDEKPDDENPDDEEPEEDPTYTISGNIWVDKNTNGIRDNDEAIKNVIVKIIDINNNNIFLKDKNGNEIEVKTNENGKYEITGIPKGTYNLIFKYDTSAYELKGNAGVKDYIIESTKEKVAITNNINLEANKNINLELMELTEFDLEIDKFISKVIVQTANGTKTSTYAKQQLVKEEIQRKYLVGSTVLVEYTIQISNIGELAGYATEIVDYLPKDMKFYSELNTQWYAGEDGNLYNTTLANEVINPGETKTIKLVLSKTMTKDNTGTTTNIAEISDMSNVKGYADINLNNNQSKADIIVNIATGTIIAYSIAAISSALILFIGMYIIKKNVIGKERKMYE